MAQVLIAIAALIVGTVGVLYARKQASPPKRVLVVDALPPATLLSAEPSLGIEVRRQGAVLTDPHLLTLTFDCDGDYDISREAFDGGEPVSIDLKVTIVELLSEELISAAFNGTILRIGPDLIKRDSRASIQLLVDGLPEIDDLPGQVESALVDVQVRTPREAKVDRSRGLKLMGAAVVAGLATAGFAIMAWAFVEDVRGSSANVDPDHVTPGSKVELSGDHYARFEVIEFQGDYESNSGEEVNLAIDDVQADESGQWAIVLTVPSDAAIGEISIYAEGSKFNGDFIEFDVIAVE